jgi:segregation and condensation protein B
MKAGAEDMNDDERNAPEIEAPMGAGPARVTSDHESRAAIEAIVMVSEEPADPRLLAQLLEIPVDRVEALCGELASEYESHGRGFELVRVAGGWRFQSCAAQSPYVERFVLTGQSARLSAAALETLAIVAYKQPISRAQVGAIRGVNVDGVMRTLQQRGYIAELARDPGPGQAVLFGTTASFLERLGLDSLDELPALGDFVPDAAVVEALEIGLRVSDAPLPNAEAEPELNVETQPAAESLSQHLDDSTVIDLRDDEFGGEVLDAIEVLADHPDAH